MKMDYIDIYYAIRRSVVIEEKLDSANDKKSKSNAMTEPIKR